MSSAPSQQALDDLLCHFSTLWVLPSVIKLQVIICHFSSLQVLLSVSRLQVVLMWRFPLLGPLRTFPILDINRSYFAEPLPITLPDIIFSKYYLLASSLVGMKSSGESQNFRIGSHYIGLFCIICFVTGQIYILLQFVDLKVVLHCLEL